MGGNTLSSDEVLSSLIHFGLEEVDAKIYLTLLEEGSISVGTMSQKLEIDRGKAYRSLKKMTDLGIINTDTNSSKIKAVEPDEAFANIIKNKKENIVELKEISESLIDDLNNFAKKKEDDKEYSFSIIQGRPNVYSKIGKFIFEAQNKIMLITTSEDLLRMNNTSIPDKIMQRTSDGLEIKIITNQCDEKAMKIIKEFGATEVKIGKLPSKSRMIIEEENQLITSGAMKETMDLNDETDSIMYTNSTDMIENMFSLSLNIWKKSKPMEVRISN